MFDGHIFNLIDIEISIFVCVSSHSFFRLFSFGSLAFCLSLPMLFTVLWFDFLSCLCVCVHERVYAECRLFELKLVCTLWICACFHNTQCAFHSLRMASSVFFSCLHKLIDLNSCANFVWFFLSLVIFFFVPLAHKRFFSSRAS